VAIRNRGIIGGSLSHADPSAELPLIPVLLDAVLTCVSPTGIRQLGARDFVLGALTTALEQDEMVTEVVLPFLPGGTGWGFEEFSRRSGMSPLWRQLLPCPSSMGALQTYASVSPAWVRCLNA
jgi:CO/xanthine dehydrogenase FAD-binding subunit